MSRHARWPAGRPKAEYHGGCTEEDGGEPDSEVAERQGDDAGGHQHCYPGYVVSGCQLGPQPTVAPTASVLGGLLELQWIIHPDRHITACAAPKPLSPGSAVPEEVPLPGNIACETPTGTPLASRQPDERPGVPPRPPSQHGGFARWPGPTRKDGDVSA